MKAKKSDCGRRKENGFTLIELLIASAIFGMLILIVTGIFLGVVGVQRKTEAVRTLQDSVRFAIEAMSRDIRTGLNFSLNGPNELRFISTIGGENQQVSYRLNIQNQIIEKGIFDSVSNQYNFSDLTPPTLTVDGLNFYLSGTQPRVTITLSAHAGQGINQTKISVQSTLSQRELAI